MAHKWEGERKENLCAHSFIPKTLFFFFMHTILKAFIWYYLLVGCVKMKLPATDCEGVNACLQIMWILQVACIEMICESRNDKSLLKVVYVEENSPRHLFSLMFLLLSYLSKSCQLFFLNFTKISAWFLAKFMPKSQTEKSWMSATI